MKKTIVLLSAIIALTSCNSSTSDTKEIQSASGIKTAYVDTSKLMDENLEAKDIKSKYDALLEEKGKKFDAEVALFQSEAANFEKNAQQYGMQWAQTKGAELRKKEQYLAQQEQLIVREAQLEGSKEMDSLVKRIRVVIKEYGKEKGYDYIYGTGESATVLYGKEENDLTQEFIKMLNEKYTATSKKVEEKK
ncbi:OmpH family outer membrane protein [Flavobacterium sp. UBA6135]|uniref:OmpH family outer membrane protein n=1 Tax=Flavobacterium sp. UBA6135 TaxID=1946553 RepID=UPI0025C609CD|nr:OmpH family outer membrane protein [Flavobacterium sp. UBA6135]